MDYHLIMCRSLTYAQRALYVLERGGMKVSLVKLPQSISKTGCSYGVRVPSKRLHACIDLLQSKNVSYGKVFRYGTDGDVEEVGV